VERKWEEIEAMIGEERCSFYKSNGRELAPQCVGSVNYQRRQTMELGSVEERGRGKLIKNLVAHWFWIGSYR
jgi:hypothetical protein